MPRIALPLIQRLNRNKKVTRNGCWVWTGGLDEKGYGYTTLHVGRASVKTIKIHRVSYIYYCGAITKGNVIDHLCRNKKCFNPLHLESVTVRENNERNKKKFCKRGHLMSESGVGFHKNHGRYCRECNNLRQRAKRNKDIKLAPSLLKTSYAFNGKDKIKMSLPSRIKITYEELVDITPSISLGKVTREVVSLLRCVCGKDFSQWGFLLGDTKENYCECPHCHRLLFFQRDIRVYEVKR